MSLFVEKLLSLTQKASVLATKNPVLRAGVVHQERDTKKCKVGDGVTNWNDLPYLTSTRKHVRVTADQLLGLLEEETNTIELVPAPGEDKFILLERAFGSGHVPVGIWNYLQLAIVWVRDDDPELGCHLAELAFDADIGTPLAYAIGDPSKDGGSKEIRSSQNQLIRDSFVNKPLLLVKPDPDIQWYGALSSIGVGDEGGTGYVVGDTFEISGTPWESPTDPEPVVGVGRVEAVDAGAVTEVSIVEPGNIYFQSTGESANDPELDVETNTLTGVGEDLTVKILEISPFDGYIDFNIWFSIEDI